MIGEVGFGEVWLAEQLRPVRRQVALKLIKPGMDSKQVIARFESERRALALMEHPYIAKIFDAGLTRDGRSLAPFRSRVDSIPLHDVSDCRSTNAVADIL